MKKTISATFQRKKYFFKFFSGFKGAKLNKKKCKKNIFLMKNFEKKIKNCLFLGQKHLFFGKVTTFFGVFRVFSLFFYFEVWNKSWISLISWKNTSLLWKNQKISNRSCHKKCRVSSPLNPMAGSFDPLPSLYQDIFCRNLATYTLDM